MRFYLNVELSFVTFLECDYVMRKVIQYLCTKKCSNLFLFSALHGLCIGHSTIVKNKNKILYLIMYGTLLLPYFGLSHNIFNYCNNMMKNDT